MQILKGVRNILITQLATFERKEAPEFPVRKGTPIH